VTAAQLPNTRPWGNPTLKFAVSLRLGHCVCRCILPLACSLQTDDQLMAGPEDLPLPLQYVYDMLCYLHVSLLRLYSPLHALGLEGTGAG
jgi:hypothetical protein